MSGQTRTGTEGETSQRAENQRPDRQRRVDNLASSMGTEIGDFGPRAGDAGWKRPRGLRQT